MSTILSRVLDRIAEISPRNPSPPPAVPKPTKPKATPPAEALAAIKAALEPYRQQIIDSSVKHQRECVEFYRTKLKAADFDFNKAFPFDAEGGSFVRMAVRNTAADAERFVNDANPKRRSYNPAAPRPVNMKMPAAIGAIIKAAAERRARDMLDAYAYKLALKQASVMLPGQAVVGAKYEGHLWEESTVTFCVDEVKGDKFVCHKSLPDVVWKTRVITNYRHNRPYDQFPTRLLKAKP